MSFLTRVFNLFRNPIRYVGRDLEGNRFFEYPSTSDDPRRTRRTVQYKDSEDVWKYIGGGRRLPVQWSTWLSHTRKHPPTLEELRQDFERQQRVLANVAMIEARDQEEREARLRIKQDMKEESTKRAQIERGGAQALPEAKSIPSQPLPKNEDPGASISVDETESWSPKTIRRRG